MTQLAPCCRISKTRIACLAPLLLVIPAATQEKPASQSAPKSSAGEKAFSWNKAAQESFARRRLDPANWNLAMLQRDIDAHAKYPPADGSMPYLPAPTVPYVSNGSLAFEKIRFGEATVLMGRFDWARFGFNAELCGPDASRNYCNIGVLMSDPGTANRGGAMTSRAYPHIQANGYLESCIGDVVWSFQGFATGANYLNVNRHIFDMEFSRTVLVAPQQDGSLRFLQPDSAALAGGLTKNKEIIAFFNSKTAVNTTTPQTRLPSRREHARELQRALDDRTRMHGYLAKTGDVERSAVAAVVGQEDVRVRSILLRSIDQVGYPSPARLKQHGDRFLRLLWTPPVGASAEQRRLHLQLVRASLMKVLRKNADRVRNHAAFGLTYTPDLPAEVFAHHHDTFLIQQLGEAALYGCASKGEGLPIVRSLEATNRARQEIALPPLTTDQVRQTGK